MEDLKKVNSMQLYEFWKNLSVGLFVLICTMAFSKLLPFFLSPVVSLAASAVLYTILYNAQTTRSSECMTVTYCLFFCLIFYSFITIIANVLFAWGIVYLPAEFIFFTDPYLPTLWLNPICFLVCGAMYLRRRNLKICSDCRFNNGMSIERGSLGQIYCAESAVQLKNLVILFGVLSVIVWSYYLLEYRDTNTNAKDNYVFIWATIIAFVLDEVYFIIRYYNLYLDLKENNEIISQQELRDMTAKTYLRFYVICGDKMYIDKTAVDPRTPYMNVMDTPFFTKRSVNGITLPEVKQIIRKLTGQKEGELKFFFGRRSADISKNSVLRYFYFLDGKPEDYPDLNVNGEWVDFNEIKKIYSHTPGKLSSMFLTDITRLATIILTEKIFNENGYRKMKLRSYAPTFNLLEVRKSELDFQDDKWIRISLFNSDTRFYGMKKWWRSLSGKKRVKVQQ